MGARHWRAASRPNRFRRELAERTRRGRPRISTAPQAGDRRGGSAGRHRRCGIGAVHRHDQFGNGRAGRRRQRGPSYDGLPKWPCEPGRCREEFWAGRGRRCGDGPRAKKYPPRQPGLDVFLYGNIITTCREQPPPPTCSTRLPSRGGARLSTCCGAAVHMPSGTWSTGCGCRSRPCRSIWACYARSVSCR